MPLNIDWQQILLHLFNFVILFAVLYFLLYKPVKQFMDKRTQHYQDMEDEAKAKLAQAEKTKAEYAARLSGVEEEISAEKEQARKELEAAKVSGLRQAEEQAAKILTDARVSAERERAKILKEAQGEITEMVTAATEKLVADASTSAAYDQFLASVQRGESNEQ